MVHVSAPAAPQDLQVDNCFRIGEFGIVSLCSQCGEQVEGFTIIAQPGMYEMHCRHCGYHADSIYCYHALQESSFDG